jgi:hypothetical protein
MKRVVEYGGHFQYSGSFKVSHPNVSNNIPQMRSMGFQPPFIAGGNQVAYNLGIKTNSITSVSRKKK